jgi:SSS family solute:Na+ symporter
LKGLSFAALTAAVVASLAGKANSISTIFTLDIFKNYIGKNADEKTLVRIGRIVVVVAMILAIIVSPYMGIDKKGGFQFIQEMTGLLSPGIFASFIMGFLLETYQFSRRIVRNRGRLSDRIGDAQQLFPIRRLDAGSVPGPYGAGIPDMRSVVMVILGLVMPDEKKALAIDSSMFVPHRTFIIGAVVVLAIIIFLYSHFW